MQTSRFLFELLSVSTQMSLSPRERERTIEMRGLPEKITTVGHTPRLTAEQQSAPPRSELMRNTMDSLVYSPRTLHALALSPRNVNPEHLERHMRGEVVRILSGGNNQMLREAARRRDTFTSRTLQLRDPLLPRNKTPRDNPPQPSWWGSTDGAGRAAEQALKVKRTFGRFDANNNGLLEVKELRRALLHHGVNMNGVNASAILSAYDDNPDGKLDLAEFTLVVRDLTEQRAALEPHPPISPRRPQPPLQPPPVDLEQEAAASRLQHEIRAHQAEKHEERAEQQRAAMVVQKNLRGAKGRKKYLDEKDRLVSHYHKLLQKQIQTRFKSYARCFRMIDADNSGSIDPAELKTHLPGMFNLTIPDSVMEDLIKLTDKDGDGEIRFAEFARVFSADDVHAMKKTLQAAGGESRILQSMREPMSETNMPMPIKVYNTHFAPGSFIPSFDCAAPLRRLPNCPRGFPKGTDLRPPPRTVRLQNAFRLGLKAQAGASSYWSPRAGPLAFPAGKKSDVHVPLSLGWDPRQLGVGVDEPGISNKTLKWLGVKEAPL
jgi:Ca2+-binding EF-hand superfamily protein